MSRHEDAGNALDAKEREASYRKAIALEPDAAAAQNGLAWWLVENGRAREALPFANRAVDLALWNPAFVDTLAVVASELGQCPQALQLAHRAAEALPPGSQGARAVRRHVDDFERRCGSPLAPLPAAVPERP
jgi:Tfp pilus assembly protein PilF